MTADDWDERYRGSDLVWGSEPNRFVRQQCERLPVGRAVDLACGEGRNALWLARRGWHVTGVDYSPVAIERARALTAREPELTQVKLKWQVADVTTLSLKPLSVDLALISYVHLPPDQRRDIMMSAAAAVRPRGHLLIVGHDRRNLAEGVSGPQDPDLLYVPSELRTTVEEVDGLVVEVARTVERPTPDGVALDTLLRARRTDAHT